MLCIKNIFIRNFLSIGNVSQAINFENGGLVLVLGENLDLGGNDSRNGVGKAQPLSAKVKIPGGWGTIGDIAVGDVISTPDGKTTNVTGVFPQGKKKTYQFRFSDGRATLACEDHLWKVFSHSFSGDKFKTITTKEIIEHNEKYKNYKNKSTYYKYVPLCLPEEMSDINLPLDPYFLGAMLGNGSFSDSGIGFSTSDLEVFKNMQNTLPSYLQMHKDKHNTHGYSFTLQHQTRISPFTKCLEELKLKGTLSYSKFIPDMYKDASNLQKIYLLQGLIDTDGFVDQQGCLSIATVSKRLANDIQYIVRSIGGIAKISLKENGDCRNSNGILVPCKNTYTVSIMYHTLKLLSRLSRKQDRLSGDIYQYKNRKLRIDNIEYIGEVESQCIMVDHADHLYITDDFVVTHNSAIVNALAYVLYGEALAKIKKDNLINKVNAKNMMVALEFEKKGNTYRIERGRKPAFFKFIVNGTDISNADTNESQGDNRLTQREVEKTLELSLDMFKQIVALNTYNEPFLSLRANDQRLIIEQLLGITQLSEKAEVLKEQLRNVKDTIKTEEIKINAINETNSKIRSNILSLNVKSRRWQSIRDCDIADAEHGIGKLSSISIINELENHKTNSDNNLLLQQHRALTKECNIVNRDLSRYKKSVELAQINLALTDTEKKCPKCHTELNAEMHDKFHAEYELEIQETIKVMSEKQTALAGLKFNLEKINVTDPIDTVYTCIDEAYNHKATLIELKNNLTRLSDSMNPYCDQIETLETEGIQIIDNNLINKLSSLRDHQEFLLKLLINKDSFIRKKIIDQNLMFLNSRLSHYLITIGLPHSVKFISDLSVEITELGRDYDFDNLSRGERTRLILSLSWAFRDVYESLTDKINLLFIDELIDTGVDIAGVEGSISILKSMVREQNRNIFLISHRDELIGRVSSVLKVIKSNGFTEFDSADTNLI